MRRRVASLAESSADFTRTQRRTLHRLVQSLANAQWMDVVDHQGQEEDDVDMLMPKLVEELARVQCLRLTGRPTTADERLA